MKTYRVLIQLHENRFILGSLLAAYDRDQRSNAIRIGYGSKHKSTSKKEERIHDWPGRSALARDF